MNIHIASDGNRTIRLTKTEIKTLRRANMLIGELCRCEPSLVARLDDWGACGLSELLELPFCKERQTSLAVDPDDPDFEVKEATAQTECNIEDL